MSKTKTNVNYLRELIVGQLEANEFLDAVLIDIQLKDKKIKELQDEDCDCVDYDETIETGMEPLNWSCANLGIQSMMESFGEKLKKVGYIKMEEYLKSL